MAGGCNSSLYGYSSGGYGQSYIVKFEFPFNYGISIFAGNLIISTYNCASTDTTDFVEIFI